jgi:hypothetical protein
METTIGFGEEQAMLLGRGGGGVGEGLGEEGAE